MAIHVGRLANVSGMDVPHGGISCHLSRGGLALSFEESGENLGDWGPQAEELPELIVRGGGGDVSGGRCFWNEDLVLGVTTHVSRGQWDAGPSKPRRGS